MYHSMSRSPLDTFPKNVLPSRAKAKARKSVNEACKGTMHPGVPEDFQE